VHVSKTVHPERPSFQHPAFDYENRIVLVEVAAVTIASVYVPNGGKDFPAKMRFLASLEEFVAALHAESKPVVICGDLNIARTEMDVHPKERKATAIGQLPEERDQLERIIAHGLVDVGRALEPDNDQMFDVRRRPELYGAERHRHERSRAGPRGLPLTGRSAGL
jgi:exodeoxyribonuclease-3